MKEKYSNIKAKDQIELFLNDNTFIFGLCEELSTLMYKSFGDNGEQIMCCPRKYAPILGLYVKIYKFWIECEETFKEGKSGVYIAYCRILYEAFTKMNSLILGDEQTLQNFQFNSYRRRLKGYQQISHRTDGVSGVMTKKFLDDITQDGFTIDEMKEPKRNEKNFKELSATVQAHSFTKAEQELIYTFAYGISSDAIHSDWGELRQFYLISSSDGTLMMPKLDNDKDLDYRGIITTANIIIKSIAVFISFVNEQKIFLTISENIFEQLENLYRIFSLISEYIFDEYKNNPYKYMKI